MFLRISRPQTKWVTFLTLYLYYIKPNQECQVFFQSFFIFFSKSTGRYFESSLQPVRWCFSTSPLTSSGVGHTFCRVVSNTFCHRLQYQTVHRAALTSMTRLVGYLPVGIQTDVGCIPTMTQLYRVLVESSLLFHLSVGTLLQFLFVCSYSLVHDMVNAESFAK